MDIWQQERCKYHQEDWDYWDCKKQEDWEYCDCIERKDHEMEHDKHEHHDCMEDYSDHIEHEKREYRKQKQAYHDCKERKDREYWQQEQQFFTTLFNKLQTMSPLTTYHHQNWLASSKPTFVHQPILVTQSKPTPPPVLTPPASIKPSVVHQPKIKKIKTMKTETNTKKKIIKPPPVLSPESNNPLIRMEH